MHPFTDYKALAEEGSRIIVKAKGVWLEDSDGKSYLDGMAGLWCSNVGHGREEIAEAVYEQMKELAYYNSFFKTSNPPAIMLAEKLAELAPPHLNRVFFCGSGSEANDTVVRLVRYYWSLLGKPEKTVIIARQNAYQGSTMAGASLGGMQPMHAQGGMPIPGIVHIPQPYWFGEGFGEDPVAFGKKCADQIEDRIDKREDVRDRREDSRDRRENRRDRRRRGHYNTQNHPLPQVKVGVRIGHQHCNGHIRRSNAIPNRQRIMMRHGHHHGAARPHRNCHR
jgi:putrescine aminotransferase